ncbi:MAG: DinB family protein [Pyrinomonadaceae bacterium]
MDLEPLIETWHINNRINIYLLEAIPSEDLGSSLSSKGRSAGEQFVHIHNVRLMWLKAAMPEELENQVKLEKENANDKDLLRSLIERSGTGIAKLLAFAAANGGRVKGFKPHVSAFVGYLIAHDAHHRSQAIIALKQSGHPLDKKILYGIWEWGTR